ncbi:MAG: hypothetical protein ACXQTS_05360 [Candidatus Methanospirareceae archaeon]
MTKKEFVRVLNPNYDLRQESDIELIETLKKLCDTYIMCKHEISTAIADVWNSIVQVAEEIVRRGKW